LTELPFRHDNEKAAQAKNQNATIRIHNTRRAPSDRPRRKCFNLKGHPRRHPMKEQHSTSSLSARLGVTRAAALGAIAAGRIKATATQIGARQIYTIEQSEIEAYRSEFVAKLKERVNRIESDPRRAFEKTSSALASVRKEVAAEAEVHTPRSIAERYGIGLEAASYLLNKYAERVENGFKISAEARKKIEKHIEETRGGSVIKNGYHE
jgi:ribosomal protein S25